MINIYESVSANQRKSWLIIVSFWLFTAVAVYFISKGFSLYFGYDVSGVGLVGIGLIISGIISFLGYWYSDKIILTISNARPANRKKDFVFYTVAENLAIGAGFKKPRLYVIEDSAPNAFATGRDPDHAVICATRGLITKLSRSELEGVIAHEIAHIRNYDTLLMSVTSVLLGLVTLIADWFLRSSWHRSRWNNDDEDRSQNFVLIPALLFALVSPLVARLIQLAISRRREFLADASAVFLTRQPEGLISALLKISSDREALEAANKATAHLYFVNPFRDKDDPRFLTRMSSLFNTHPPISERIKALESML